MTRYTGLLHCVWHLTGTLLILLVDVVRFPRLCLCPSTVLAAENLFLRKQLACYQERHVKPRVAYLLAADNDHRPLLARLSDGNQPVICSRNPFSRLHLARLACL